MRFARVACFLWAAMVLGSGRSWAQDTHLLIVAGLGGEPVYAEMFRTWSQSFHAAAEKRLGIPRDHIVYLSEDPSKDPERINGRATREDLAKAFRDIATRCRPGDTFAVVLFGHGSGLGEEARFNLPGPDASARDFATWLVPFSLQRVVFANTASASGDFQKVLAGKNRVILTATKSSQERNEAMFGRYFSEALSNGAADVDKDGRISILEAFDAAKAQVATEYQRERRLLTEHATLEDGASGALARSTFLGGRASDGDSAALSTLDPVIKALDLERKAIEDKVETLKAAREGMPADVYERELEKLLIDLALKNEELRKHRGGVKP